MLYRLKHIYSEINKVETKEKINKCEHKQMNPIVFQINNITHRNDISGTKNGRGRLFSSFVNDSPSHFHK